MLVRAYLKAYGLVLVVFIAIVYWAYLDRAQQKEIVLADTAVIATQQSQLISKGISVFHVAARYLLSEVVSRIEHEHLSMLDRNKALQVFYGGLLKHKLLDAPFLHGLSIIGQDCSVLVASDTLHGNVAHGQSRCDHWRTSMSSGLHVHVLEPSQKANDSRVVAFSRKVVDSDGEFLGAVSTALDLDFVQDWFAQYASRRNESVTLFGEQGEVLTHMTYGLGQDKAREAFELMRARSAQSKTADPSRRGAALSSAGVGAADSVIVSDIQSFQNHETVYALSRVEGLPMYVMVSYGIPLQLANWREHSVRTGLFVFGLFLLSLASVNSYLRVLQQRESLAELATTDALTGMHNRRHLMEVGAYEVRRANRYMRPLTMLLIDADHFKEVNDQWGHGAGDLVLKRLGATIQSNLRQTDVGARIGGEEFVVLLPETPLEKAQMLAQRLRQAVESLSVQVSSTAKAGVTVSIGVAGLQLGETLDQLMSRADQCLYDAKEKGRNQVVMAEV